MARSHAKILTSIWQDEDFVGLSAAAQRMYFVLISQPKLSTCGVVDYMPSRLARTCRGMDAGSVEAAVTELEQHRFVIVDHSTDEVMIRTFVRNDGVCHRWQMVVSMWSAWGNVLSERIRLAIVVEAPIESWETPKATPPDDALAMRLRVDCQSGSQSGSQSDSDPQQLTTTTTTTTTTSTTPAACPSALIDDDPPAVTAPVADAPRDTNRRFDEFWEIYPRKIGKPTAHTKWAAKTKHTDPDAVIAGAGRWAAHWRDANTETQYVPHPATWLNSERWNDTPPPVRRAATKAASNDDAAARIAAAITANRSILAIGGRR